MRRPLILTLLLAAVAAAPAGAQQSVTICHATGNPDGPYAELTLSNEGVLAHVNHEDDLVPAPEGGCPPTEVVLPEDTPVPQYAIPTPAATPAPTATAAPTATPRQRRPRRPRERDRDTGDAGAVKGQGGGGAGGEPELTEAPRAVRTADTRQLPMTGAELWLIAAAGAGFLMSGAGIRLLSPAPGRPPGPSGR